MAIALGMSPGGSIERVGSAMADDGPMKTVGRQVPRRGKSFQQAPYFRVYGEYQGSEPAFYDPRRVPAVDLLKRHWREVRREFEHFCEECGRPQPHFVPDRVVIRGWTGVKLVTFGRPYRGNLAAFPRTERILRSIPGLVSASINILEPGTIVPVHHGDSDLCYRVHLGLIVPAGVEQCGIQVGEERRGWEEGGVLVFNDACAHFVWNKSPAPRVILLCDVLKEPFIREPRRSCAAVLATIALLFLQFRVPWSRKLPPSAWGWALRAARVPFSVYLQLFGWEPAVKERER